MNRFFFISTETLSKAGIVIFICWLFGFTKLWFLLIVALAVLLFLFRRKQIDLGELRLSEKLLILSPISGKALQAKIVDENKIELKMKMFTGFGIYMPISGEVIDFKEEFLEKNKFITSYNCSLTLEDSHNNIFVLSFKAKLQLFRPRIAVRVGDMGRLGATIGFLPFGGKVSLDFDKKLKVTFQDYKRVTATQTVIANIEEKL